MRTGGKVDYDPLSTPPRRKPDMVPGDGSWNPDRDTMSGAVFGAERGEDAIGMSDDNHIHFYPADLPDYETNVSSAGEEPYGKAMRPAQPHSPDGKAYSEDVIKGPDENYPTTALGDYDQPKVIYKGRSD